MQIRLVGMEKMQKPLNSNSEKNRHRTKGYSDKKPVKLLSS